LKDPYGKGMTSPGIPRQPPPRCRLLIPSVVLLLFVLFQPAGASQARSVQPDTPASPLPEPPSAPISPIDSKQRPCRVIPRSRSAGITLVSATAAVSESTAGIPLPAQSEAPPPPSKTSSSVANVAPPPCPTSTIDPFSRFISEPHAPPLTPKQKAVLAFRNLIDPFNAVTILGTAAVSIGSDAHTAYGPGLKGFAKNVGVAYTEDIQGEFFGTFLIPSIAHQDPRYYRMPHSSIPRRVLNSIVSVYWSRSDSGKGMPNYATFIGFAINSEIINLYVPGIETDRSATAQRYITGLAAAPIDNFITEFLPDVASHIHVRVVIVQRIINQVAKTEPMGAP
jgi:hypothetical protein